MPRKKYIIDLASSDRAALEQVSASDRSSVREKTRARILLASDVNRSREEGGSFKDSEIASRYKVSAVMVAQVRQRSEERGALSSIRRQEQKVRAARKLDGRQEAHLIAITCSTPPEGASRWSLRLVRDRLIEMQVVESIGLETIRTTLKKTNSSRG